MPEPSASTLEDYRATADKRRRDAERQRALRRERAWTAARAMAYVLRSQYHVQSVVVFGSLATQPGLYAESDIDLAVSGIAPGDYLEALGRLQAMGSGEFAVDLVDLAKCHPAIEEAVRREGVSL